MNDPINFGFLPRNQPAARDHEEDDAMGLNAPRRSTVPVVILDHNDPARVRCNSAGQKTFMARIHEQSHSEIPAEAQAELDRALEYGRIFDKFLDKLTGGGAR